MKRIIMVMLVSFSLCFALVGCGGGDSAAEPQEEVLVAESIVGIWECEDFSMGEMTTKEAEELFEMKVNEMAALTAYSNGTAEFSFLGDIGQVSWKESDEGYSIVIDNEEMSASLKDNKLTVISTDGDTTFTMVFNYKGRASEVIKGWDLELSDKEALDMSNFMVAGPALIADGKLYGVYGGAEYGTGAFCMSKVKTNSTPSIGKETVICEDCYVTYLCEYDDAVYGVLNMEKIVKIVDGNMETIYKGFCDYMQIVNGKIYFSGEDYKFYSINLDGSGKTVVVDKSDMYYPYVLPNDMLIYQNDPDNESLHVYNMKTKEDFKLNNEVSYNPVVYGDYVYYTVPTDDGMYKFKRLDLYTGKSESSAITMDDSAYLIENGNIVFSVPGNPSFSVDEWDKIEEGGFSGIVTYTYYSNGEVRVLCSSDGEIFISGTDSENKTSIGFNFVE